MCIYSHSGFKALLMVPAMHAADRRSLNSNPSFDTSVTYSLTFSEFITATLVVTGQCEPCVCCLVLAIAACGREDRSKVRRGAPFANTKARHHVSRACVIVLANTVLPYTSYPSRLFTNAISKVPEPFCSAWRFGLWVLSGKRWHGPAASGHKLPRRTPRA